MLSYVPIPPEPTLSQISYQFEQALVAGRHPAIIPRKPDYNAWLESLYTAFENQGEFFRFYPTNGQDRPSVVDSYPKDLEPWTEKSSAPTPGFIPLPPRKYYPLEEQIGRILKGSGIGDGNTHFKVGRGISAKVFAKIYGCLKTNSASRFAERLVDQIKGDSDLNFDGKFYELMSFDSQNKLCLYVPFGDLPAVTSFLGNSAEYFHPVDFNHPVGVHLMPGISAVIVAGKGGFDEIISNQLEKADTRSRQAFVSSAKKILGESPTLRYHFDYLTRNGK